MTDSGTAPVLAPGPTAFHVLQRNSRARLAVLGCLLLGVLSLTLAAPLSLVLGAVAAVGFVVFAYVIYTTMRSFAPAAEAERTRGYTTVAKLWNPELFLLDARTGEAVRTPGEPAN